MTLEELVSYAKRYGFVFPGSEIYGGLANAWDYGPLGTLTCENIKKLWFKKFVDESKSNVRLDSPIILNSRVWEASGHLSSFNDPKVDCKSCHNRERADKLIEKHSKGAIDADGMKLEDIDKWIEENNVKCPVCGKSEWTPCRTFSLMYKTSQGVYVRSKSELIIAERLEKQNIPYRYEWPLKLRDGQIVYPDFTILHPQTLKIYYFEHFGMIGNPEYADNAIRKINTYAVNGILLDNNLTAAIEAALRANSVIQYCSTAVRAGCKSGNGGEVVRTPAVSSLLGDFSFRMCHN